MGGPVTDTALRLEGLSKAYGATQALRDVSLTVEPGTIHALLGGNGSGKSTLIKVLAGVVPADAGRLLVAGAAHDLRTQTPARARQLRLHFVHQQSSTFPAMTVAENLSLGRGFETAVGGRVDWAAVRRRARGVLERFEIEARPDDLLATVGPATQMMVAIARALQDDEADAGGTLVLDEPTASLPAHEVELLLTTLQRCADRGYAVVYVTHRLDEVLRVADRGTVLRDGRVVAAVDPRSVGHDELVELIMGRPAQRLVRERGDLRDAAPVVLRGAGLGRSGGVALEARAGEVVGVAGIMGSGRTTLLRQLFGLGPGTPPTIELDGRRTTVAGPREAMRHGIAYLPEDRPREAMFAQLSIAENLSIAALGRHASHGCVSRASERRAARSIMSELRVDRAAETAPISSLSGGNQQKVMLARWLQRRPRVLLLDEPTQGVDAGARVEIHQLVRRAVDGGAAAVIVSSDFEELALVCDRAIVLRDGAVAAELDDDIDEERLNALAYARQAA